MKIVSLVKSIILSGSERPPTTSRSQLKVGDRLVGRVLELKGNGRAFIDFGRFRAMAHVRFPVRQGEVVHVKVMDNGTPLRLGLRGPDPGGHPKAQRPLALDPFPPRRLTNDLQSQIRPLLASVEGGNDGQTGKTGSAELTIAARSIMSALQPINMGKGASRISGQLKQLIENAGIFYEKRLEKAVEPLLQGRGEVPERQQGDISGMRNVASQDLKANLLVLKAFLDAKDPAVKMLELKDMEGLRKTVEKLLGEITGRQNDTGGKSTRSETVQVYTYLLPMSELAEDAKVKVYYSKKKKGSGNEEGFRVSLLLSMQKLGQIRTDFLLKGKSLSIDFWVEEPSVKRYVDDHLDGLRSALGDLFDRASIKVGVSEKEIAQFDFEDLAPVSAGLIDFRV